jgi:hypothetical protein
MLLAKGSFSNASMRLTKHRGTASRVVRHSGGEGGGLPPTIVYHIMSLTDCTINQHLYIYMHTHTLYYTCVVYLRLALDSSTRNDTATHFLHTHTRFAIQYQKILYNSIWRSRNQGLL